MKRVVGPAGYTIVETMIFLAVSAALFVSASVLITGRQRRTQFATTVKDFSSKLQSVYGNVASGYYNSTGNVTCSVSGNNLNLAIGGSPQGTNGACMYLGQVIVSPQQGSSNFQIISLVGARQTGNPPQEISSLTQAIPTLYKDTAETYTLEGADFWSLSADGQPVTGADGSSVAFVGSLAPYDNSQQALQNGASHTDLYGLAAGGVSQPSTIESGLSANNLQTVHTVAYCLTNGEQYAQIKLEGGTASYEIGNNVSVCG